ncbi:toll/interleukin-1 receptor domain-containing protein [Magnetococcus sp. PR-3]|uniref:toll/interleukin-1 receptor domain-containing protein n=1 Tax=Magnetococcus sp. PR-3 TaxID=3120355 RepID=UPI002FCE16ED
MANQSTMDNHGIVMADICIFYAKEDRGFVEKLDTILSRHWTVWWDRKNQEANWRQAVDRELQDAKCVIPIWSVATQHHETVPDEAKLARQLDVPLIPIRTVDCLPPLGFGSTSYEDVFNWGGEEEHSGIQTLIRLISKVTAVSNKQTRAASPLDVDNKRISFPTFFFSVSSHETPLQPDKALEVLRLYKAKTILVSAYDLQAKRRLAMKNTIEQCQENGSIVLLDSGNYEAHRTNDRDWSPDHLHRVFEDTPHDFAFCFDNVSPPESEEAIVEDVLNAVRRDQNATDKPVFPIVHVPKDKNGNHRADLFLKVLPKLVRALRTPPAIVALPERELGDGILNRAKMVHAIRRELDTFGISTRLHMLGTGNPLSLAILTAAGADSFDGLEWCRVVADHETGRLFHFQQADLFRFQSQMAKSEITRLAMTEDGINFEAKALFHNLAFFDEWVGRVLDRKEKARLPTLLANSLPRGAIEELENQLPEVFA